MPRVAVALVLVVVVFPAVPVPEARDRAVLARLVAAADCPL